MKKYSILFFVFISFLFLFASNYQGKVVAVKDGDTIEILVGKTIYTIRLNGIDCPEKSQSYGENAKKFTSSKCFGTYVKVIKKDVDKYGRIVGDVILSDGNILNQELLKNGFAWHYKKYSSDIRLSQLENEARKKKIGLWKESSPTPPWEFRQWKKQTNSKYGQCIAYTKKGNRCKKNATKTGYCRQHNKIR